MSALPTYMGLIRGDSLNLPLFLHVLGALALFGTIVMAAGYLFSARRSGDAATLRLGLRALLIGVLPAWLVLRVSAEWIADKERLNDLDDPPQWLDIGYMVAEPSLLLILIAALCTWLALRRTDGESTSSGVATAAGVLAVLVIVLNVVAIWAMTTKPG